MTNSFEVKPRGPFDLETANAYFGGWPRAGRAVVMAFPVEGWKGSAAVAVTQSASKVSGLVHSTGADAEAAWGQALAAVSLDVDGRGFAAVAARDPVIGRFWEEFGYLRPVLFHSPYEAACSFIIGHRISIPQTRRIRERLAEAEGEAFDVEGVRVHAFPTPERLLQVSEFKGISPVKIKRLHAVAKAALVGNLDRARLRATPKAEALAELRQLPGVGGFFSQGILTRGAGLTDAITDDGHTPIAVQRAYGLKERPTMAQVLEIAEGWRPYRMWALVLLHVWIRRQPGGLAGPNERGAPAGRPS